LYLSDAYDKEWQDIVRLANSDKEEDREKLTKYVMEACRLSTISPQLSRVAAKDMVLDDKGKKVSCKAGERLFVDLVHPLRLRD
jgi:cytochrome P450